MNIEDILLKMATKYPEEDVQKVARLCEKNVAIERMMYEWSKNKKERDDWWATIKESIDGWK